jgi:hypothetical protein
VWLKTGFGQGCEVASRGVVTGFDQQDHGRRLGEEAMRRLRLGSVCAIDAGLTDSEVCRGVEQEFASFLGRHRLPRPGQWAPEQVIACR